MSLWPSAQAALAAGLAWLIAHDLIGHPQPFFAPISAAISLSTNNIRRGRRIAQMVVGVSLGIAVSELAAKLVGTGPLQIGGVVLVTMAVALFVGLGFFSEGMMFVNQSVASAILVIALRAHGTGSERLLDALVGGGTAAVIGVGLFAADPLAVIRAAEREVLRSVAGSLRRVARLFEERTPAQPGWSLAATQLHHQLGLLAQARGSARATARIAPRRWRLRAAVAAEEARTVNFDLMANAALSLFRAALGALDTGEAIPPSLTGSVAQLAVATLSERPQPWSDQVLAEVAGRLQATLDAVAPQLPPRAPVIAALVRATARERC